MKAGGRSPGLIDARSRRVYFGGINSCRILGHSSAVITLRTYAHLWPGDEDRTRSVMDATLDVLRTRCGPTDLEPAANAAAEDLDRDVSAGQEA